MRGVPRIERRRNRVLSETGGGVGSLNTAQPVGTIGSYWPYATSVWDYINRAMPYQDAGTLQPDEVYGVTAYLLHLNDLFAQILIFLGTMASYLLGVETHFNHPVAIVGQDVELTRHTLPGIEMPNRHGFVDDAKPDVR